MVFSSVSFLCFLLPLTLGLHTLLKGTRLRNGLLLAASLLFYSWGELQQLPVLLLAAFISYGFGLLLSRRKSKILLALAVIFQLGLLLYFKYAAFLWSILQGLLPLELPALTLPTALPLGISFYTFQCLSYTVDVYRGEAAAEPSFFRLLLYVAFFPQLVAGPIVKYREVAEALGSRQVTHRDLSEGIERFLQGLGKKLLLAGSLGYMADSLYALEPQTLGRGLCWLAALAYYYQIYFDFSGYSDMAIGLGRLFGFHYGENFRLPYESCSIQEFWRRWHISLSSWFRDYLYIPLGGNRKGKGRTLINLMLVFFLTGLWHGAGVNFILWGLLHGTILLLERRKKKKSQYKAVGFVLTQLTVFFGWTLFRLEDPSQLLSLWKNMISGGAAQGEAIALLGEFTGPYYVLLLVLAAVLATSLPRKLGELGHRLPLAAKADASPAVQRIAKPVVYGLLLLLCFMRLAANGYNPFIYFRF